MSKANRLLMVILALIFISALVSGCYTIVGYPPEVERGAVEVEPDEAQVYRYRGYYDTYPYSYYWDYHDPYYNYWYPRYYYRDYYPWRYYDDYYYWDYGGRYVPEKRRDTDWRGSIGSRRSLSPERERGSRLKEDEDEKPSREIQSGQSPRDSTQRSVRRKQRDSSSNPRRRSSRRGSQDEEEQ